MAGKILFEETQKFRQLWVWIIILISAGFWLYSIIVQVFLGRPLGNEPSSDIFLIFIGLIPLALMILFFSIKLITIVDQEGVHYRFYPFQRKGKTISPEDILEYEVRKYKPVVEYGGWGVRVGRPKYGNAYNVSGNIGMQFILRNGKKFLLGTQRPDAFTRALDKLTEKGKQEHSMV